jgi:hypothetical protein
MARPHGSWWEDDPLLNRRGESARPVQAPNGDDFQLSAQELQLFLRLRSLEGGSYTVLVMKTARGRDGLHSWRLTEEQRSPAS